MTVVQYSVHSSYTHFNGWSLLLSDPIRDTCYTERMLRYSLIQQPLISSTVNKRIRMLGLHWAACHLASTNKGSSAAALSSSAKLQGLELFLVELLP